jgi:hypothetical protein
LNTTIVAFTAFLAIINLRNEVFSFFAIVSYMSILISGVSYSILGDKMLFKKIAPRLLYWIGIIILTGLVIYYCLSFDWI